MIKRTALDYRLRSLPIPNPATRLAAPIACTLLLSCSGALAQEQFFFSDDFGPPATASTPDGKIKFEVYGALAITEGDIVLGNAFNLIHGKETPRIQNRGLSRTSKLDRWIDGIVYYELAEDLPQSEIDKFRQAVQHWNDNTSLSIVERTSANASSINDYIDVIAGPGCGSFVGRIGGPQSLWINTKCSVGSVIHEIGHAVGLFHEHTRADRDSYITVVWDNISEDKEFNFDIVSDGVEAVLGYDYGSIMHYGTTFFSKNGNPTILVPDGVSIGQRDALGAVDIASIDAMYATDLSLATTTTTEDQGATTVVDVMASNIGALGANTIRYSLPLNPGDTVASFEGNGWSCNSNTVAVECAYDILPNGTHTSLSIRINVANQPGQAMGDGYLFSKTFDTDLSNNGVAPVSAPDMPDIPDSTPVPDVTPTTAPDPEPDNPAPTTAAATPESSSSGGGGSGWLWLVALLGFRVARPGR